MGDYKKGRGVAGARGTIPTSWETGAETTWEARQCGSGWIEFGRKDLAIRPTMRTFALKVRGDEMRGRHILEGDVVVMEHGLRPENGDVVAALVDNVTVVRSFVERDGKGFLRAESGNNPQAMPASDLVIKGVMVRLVRRAEVRNY